MSVRNTIMKAIKETTQSSAVSAAAKRAKPKGRKMPKQGSQYDVQDIYRGGMGSFEDTQGRRYKSYELGGKRYMRRSDGVWYKPMREGTWSSMLGPPKGGEALHLQWQAAKGVGAAAAGGVVADTARRKVLGN